MKTISIVYFDNAYHIRVTTVLMTGMINPDEELRAQLA